MDADIFTKTFEFETTASADKKHGSARVGLSHGDCSHADRRG
jgi:hypothetical protein